MIFPRTRFADENTGSQQVGHICSEIAEADCTDPFPLTTQPNFISETWLDEVTDIVHSWETLRHIDSDLVNASIMRVRQKNAARGYYAAVAIEKKECCQGGSDCTCHLKEQGYPKTAAEFLDMASDTLSQRGETYDTEGGERSMGKAVEAFNTISGQGLTEAEGWLLLQVLKDVRQWSRKDYHEDSAVDCVSYAALKAEALKRGE